MRLNKTQIQKLKSFNISLVYLFGSYVERKNSSLSDIDIGIVFSENIPNNISEVYNELYFMFSDMFKGKAIDIVFLHQATLELQFDVIRHGKNIFSVSEDEKSKFEDRVAMLYMDFKPILSEFNQAVLNRI
jgi:hypothetical protein